MNTASCLAHLRRLAKKAESPAELVPWLTADVLTAAGWTVHTNRPNDFIGATKGDGAEIRISLRNMTIGGTRTTHSHRGRKGFIEDTAEAMSSLLFDGKVNPPRVHISTSHEVHWSEIVAAI